MNEQEQIELKQCPFCQNEVKIMAGMGPHIECLECGYIMRQLIVGKDILEAWNTRTSPQLSADKGLIPLDEGILSAFLVDIMNLHPNLVASMICAKFGRTAIPSVEKIADLVHDGQNYAKAKSLNKAEESLVIAQAIHQLLQGKE